jgi:hypothetical protein
MIMDIIFWHPLRLWCHLCTAVLLCASNQTSLKGIRRYIEAVLLVELKSSSRFRSTSLSYLECVGTDTMMLIRMTGPLGSQVFSWLYANAVDEDELKSNGLKMFSLVSKLCSHKRCCSSKSDKSWFKAAVRP